MQLEPAARRRNSPLHRAFRRLRARIRLWRRDRGGAAFIEFAVVLPLMTAILVGAVEMSALMAAKSRALDVAATVGDLITQNKAIDEVRMGQLYNAVDAVMETGVLHAADGSSIIVKTTSAIACPCAKKSKELCFSALWSHEYDDGSLRDGYAAETLLEQMPADLAFSENDTIVMTEVTYTYKAPVQFFLDSDTFTLNEIAFHKPRFTDRVQHTGGQDEDSLRICESS